MDIVSQTYEAARKFRPCALFTGSETLDEMMRVFTSPQGIEFCIAHDFPDKGILRAFEGIETQKWGVYIDGGRRTLQNVPIAVLIGGCDFTLEYDTVEYPCRVVLMKGAKAEIVARGFSVVSVDVQEGCRVTTRTKDNAIIR